MASHKRPLPLSAPFAGLLILLLLAVAACSGDDAGPAAPALGEPEPAPAPGPDLSPPASPTGVTSTMMSPWRVKVAWEANVTDPDLVGYRLTRTGGGATVTLMDEPQNVTNFVDDHPFGGLAVYAVTAVDAQGNESPAATIVHDAGAPGAPQIVRR